MEIVPEPVRHTIETINILLTSSSRSVLYVTDPRFPPTIYGPRALCLGHKSKGKSSVRNLRYGPRTSVSKRYIESEIMMYPQVANVVREYLGELTLGQILWKKINSCKVE